eukprot:CAMPEP_0183344208 /NCGR_PEP_ID=MMETSP0164_2-20130417/9947_1 /TAXON_ID=221442 /ORGANISM="Coccolithus pelagicus ssp braarudi, Strain PLY182g" /LENGTH=130 /DNA_ID=CAMNT_0025515179 /DNA_START=519 /DNA_END=911 /DNA_ORIENTATION=-
MCCVPVEESHECRVSSLPMFRKRRAHEDRKVGPAHVYSDERTRGEHTRSHSSLYAGSWQKVGVAFNLGRDADVGVCGIHDLRLEVPAGWLAHKPHIWQWLETFEEVTVTLIIGPPHDDELSALGLRDLPV